MPKLLSAGFLTVAVSVILCILGARGLRAQVEPDPKFEVASVRPSPPLQLPLRGPIRIGMSLDGAHVRFDLTSLRDLILLAYRIRPYQLPDTSDWMTTEIFDIQATIPQGVSGSGVPEMLQSFLAERFGLRIRRERREMPVYALVVGKDGPKFKESPADELQAEPDLLKAPEGGVVSGFGGVIARVGAVSGSATGSPLFDGRGHPSVAALHMEIPRVTMAQFTEGLTRMADRPVVDRTGLTGTYQIGFDAPAQSLTRTFQGPMPGKLPSAAPPEDDPAGGSIFESVQSLGLRLEKDKAAVEIVVIEHVEKMPTEN